MYIRAGIAMNQIELKLPLQVALLQQLIYEQTLAFLNLAHLFYLPSFPTSYFAWAVRFCLKR